MLNIRDLNAYYGDMQALFEVSIHVEAGQVVAIVGANAAGKSTLLKSITRSGPRTTGIIEFEGRRIDRKPTYQIVSIGISHVPEGRGLFPYLTVAENLEMGAFLVKDPKVRKRRLQQVFELFPVLAERSRQLAGSMSGGEQQMCAIARALMSQPRLLLLDEPTLGLAPIYVERVLQGVRHIRDAGTTVLLVEQNVAAALEIADRAYVLENGRVTLEGCADEVAKNPHLKRAYLGL